MDNQFLSLNWIWHLSPRRGCVWFGVVLVACIYLQDPNLTKQVFWAQGRGGIGAIFFAEFKTHSFFNHGLLRVKLKVKDSNKSGTNLSC